MNVFSYWYLENVYTVTQNRSMVRHKEGIHFTAGLRKNSKFLCQEDFKHNFKK